VLRISSRTPLGVLQHIVVAKKTQDQIAERLKNSCSICVFGCSRCTLSAIELDDEASLLQQKSTTNRSIGTWRMNFKPSSRRPRGWNQMTRSASV
jgi:hypothetical protein